MKKIVSLLVVLAMLIGMVPAVFAEEANAADTMAPNLSVMTYSQDESSNTEYESAEAITDTGVYDYSMIANTDMTVVKFCPAVTGVYTITATADIALVGYHWVNPEWADAETTTTIEWTCSSVGQSIYIGFVSDVTLTVTKTGEASTDPGYETVVYENVDEPIEFDASGYTNMTFVDITDDVVDTAVLGDDGYYHLNTADGPILYVAFFGPSSSGVSLVSAWNYGQVKYVEYSDGEVVSITDYQDALAAYMLAENNEGNYTYGNTYHPLTSDLITMLQKIGENYSWYGEEGWVGASEDAWMFSCLTMDAPAAGDGESAFEGTGTEDDPYVIESLPADITISFADEDTAFDGVYYQYTAEKDGVLEVIALEGYAMTGCFCEAETWAYMNDGEKVAVTAGETYLFNLYAFVSGDFGLTLQYAENVDSGDDGTTDDGDDTTGDDTTVEDSGEWSGTDVEVAADECITVIFTPETDGTLTGTITSEGAGWEFQIADADAFYQSTVWSDSNPNTISEHLTAGVTYTIKIYGYDEVSWEYVAATITYELTWTPDAEEEVTGSGTAEDPYTLLIDADNHASVAAGEDMIEGENTIYFYWVAIADGTLILTFDENDPEPYVTFGLASGNGGYTHKLTVAAGDVVYLSVETYEFVAADYTFYAAFEATGDEPSDALPLYDGDNYLYIDYSTGTGVQSYTYTATQTGILYLTATFIGYDYGWGITDDTDYIADSFDPNWGNYCLTINGEVPENLYYGAVEVTEGDVVTVVWSITYEYATYEHYMTLNLNYEGYELPEPGSFDDPYEIYAWQIEYGMASPIELAAGGSVFYALYEFTDSTVTITGEGDFTVNVLTYELDEYWNEVEVWTSYTAVDGVVEFMAPAYQVIVEIINNSDADAVYTVGYYYPVGHTYNPQVIVGEGSWTASVEANSNGYYYKWTADEFMTLEGIMTITVSGSNGSWMYSVDNYGQSIYGDYHYSSQDGTDVEAWTVFEGDYFWIVVNTDHNDIENYDYDTPAGDITITITFEELDLVQGVDYPYYVDFYDICYYGAIPEATVAAGYEAWVNVTSFSGYYLVVNGAGASVTMNGVTYTDDDNDGILKVLISDYDVDVTLTNTSSEDVTYIFGYEAPLGHSLNPEIITDNGEYSTTEFEEGSNNQYYFQFIAPAAGTITVEVLNETYWQISLWNKTSYNSAGSSYKYAASNTFTMDVAAGDVVQIYGRTYSYDTYSNVAGTLSFNFTFEELNAEPGSAENPYSVHFTDCNDTPVETVEIPAGATVYYALKGFYGNVAVVTGEGAYIVYNGVTYTDEDGDGVIELVADDTTMLIQIGNSGDETAVFTVAGVYPLGTGMNPELIGEGQTVVEVEQDDENYYTSFTTTCQGYLTITISGSDWTYMIYNTSTGMFFYNGEWTYLGEWTSCTSTEDSATVTLDVVENEEIQIVVNTVWTPDPDDWMGLYGSSAAGTIYIDVDTDYDHVDDDADGCCDICETEMSVGLLGDVNSDGVVNLADVTLLMQYVMKEIDADGLNLDLANVNPDTSVNLADVTLLMQYVMKVITEFHTK